MRLFRTPFDQINLFLPVALLLASLIEYFSGHRSLWEYESIMKYVQDIIFFNGLHVCLTFIFLFLTKTGLSLIKKFYEFYGSKGFFKIAFVFIFSSLSYYYAHGIAMKGATAYALFYLALAYFRRKHDLGQSKGLLRIANIRFLESNPEFKNNRLFSKILFLEHHLITLFFFTSLVSLLSYFNLANFLGSLKNLVFWTSFSLSLFICLLLTTFAFLSPAHLRTWKIFYSFRFYIKIFGPFSAISAYAGAAVHGIEYLCVTDKIIKAEEKNNSLRVRLSEIILLTLFVLLTFVFFRFPEIFLDNLTTHQSSVMVSFAAGVILTHFYVDYLIFTPKHKFSKDLLKVLSK